MNDPALMLLLSGDDELVAVLRDMNVKHAMISPSGQWRFTKLGRVREGEAAISEDTLNRLNEAVNSGQVLRLGEWVFRRFKGVAGWSYLIERLPTVVVDRLPQHVMSALKRQIRRDGNGVIVGEPGASKGGLLLWLTMQIPDESALLISENPPNELPGSHVLHVYPPNTKGERRNLERLARLFQTVMWDRVSGPDDVHTLFGFAGARRRWFTLDASSVASAVRTLLGYMRQGVDARIETMLVVSRSVIGRPEPLNMLVRNDTSGWEEIYKSEVSGLEIMRAFEHQEVAGVGLTTRSIFSSAHPAAPAVSITRHEPAPGAAPGSADPVEVVTAFDPVPEESGGLGEESSIAAGIRKRPGRPTIDFENPLTIPMPDASELSQISELSEISEISFDDEPIAEAQTGLLTQDDLTSLTGRHKAVPGDARISGEIDLKGFINKRDGVPETTRQYHDTPDPALIQGETSNVDSGVLASLMPSAAPDPVNLSDLRITMIEEVDQSALEAISEAEENPDDFTARSDSLLSSDASIDALVNEALSESDFDDDFSDFIEEIEISEVVSEDEVRTSVASSDSLAAFVTPHVTEDDVTLDGSAHFRADPDTSPTSSVSADVAAAMAHYGKRVEVDEATRELTIDDKIRRIRNRLHDDD